MYQNKKKKKFQFKKMINKNKKKKIKKKKKKLNKIIKMIKQKQDLLEILHQNVLNQKTKKLMNLHLNVKLMKM